MEARVLQQVRAVDPAATIGEKLEMPRPAGPEGIVPHSDSSAATYAAVVRGVAVERAGKAVPTVLLPKPITVKKSRQIRPRRSNGGLGRSHMRRIPKARSKLVGAAKHLAPAIGLLGSFSPELAKALRIIMGALRPLSKLLPLLKHIKTSPHK